MISLSFLNLPGDNPQWFGFSSPQLFWPEGQRWWPRAAGSSHAGCAAGRLNPANVPWKNCLPGLLVIIFFCARMVLHCSILFHFSQPWVTLDTIWRVAWVWTEDSHRCWGAFVDYKHISPNPFPMLSIPKLATFHDTWWYLTRIWHFFRGPDRPMPGGTPEGGSHLQGAMGNPLPQVTQDIDCYYCYSTIIGRRNHTSPSNHRWWLDVG